MNIRDGFPTMFEFYARFVQQSNLIENINVSYETLLEQIVQRNKRGHVGAFWHANDDADLQKFLSQSDICRWQKLIIREQNIACFNTDDLIWENHIGHYRDCGVRVGLRICPPAKTIPKKMKRLIRAINAFQERKFSKNRPSREEIIERVAAFHFWFLIIHPFVDGNGRTGRLLAWYLLRYFGLTPFVFTNDDKYETYYLAFEKDSPIRMKLYFLHKMNSQKAV